MATKSEVLEYVSGSLYCELGVSSINGIGVKALKLIPSGTNPFVEFSEDVSMVVSSSELDDIDDGVSNWIEKMMVHSRTKQKIILTPHSQWHHKLYLNDSGSANMTRHTDGSYGALSNISSGSELVLNYTNEFRSASSAL